MGTPGYMAPEQVKGQPADARAALARLQREIGLNGHDVAVVSREESGEVAVREVAGEDLAARALVRTQFLDVSEAPATVIDEFRTRFVDTELFFDPFAKDKFAMKPLVVIDQNGELAAATEEQAVRRVFAEESDVIEWRYRP